MHLEESRGGKKEFLLNNMVNDTREVQDEIYPEDELEDDFEDEDDKDA